MKLLTLHESTSVCLLDRGNEQCKYLGKHPDNHNFYCLKNTFIGKIIDNLNAEVIKNSAGNLNGLPIGDNCPGKNKENSCY